MSTPPPEDNDYVVEEPRGWRGLSRLQRELVILAAELLCGLVLVPLLIWVGGNRVLGGYTHGTNQHAQLDRAARGVDVSYDGGRHVLVVRCEGTEVRVLPLDALPLYAHGDATSPASQPGADPRRWDSALEKNRQLVRSLVDAMLAGLAVAAP